MFASSSLPPRGKWDNVLNNGGGRQPALLSASLAEPIGPHHPAPTLFDRLPAAETFRHHALPRLKPRARPPAIRAAFSGNLEAKDFTPASDAAGPSSPSMVL